MTNTSTIAQRINTHKILYANVAIAILVACAGYIFYEYRATYEQHKEAESRTINALSRQIDDIKLDNATYREYINERLAKATSDKYNIEGKLIELHNAASLRSKAADYAPLLYVTTKLERKMIVGGTIESDVLKMKVFGSENADITAALKMLDGIKSIKGKERLMREFNRFVRMVKADQYTSSSIPAKLKSLLNEHFAIVSANGDPLNANLLKMQDAIDDGNIAEVARLCEKIKVDGAFANQYIADIKAYAAVERSLDVIYDVIGNVLTSK